MNHPESDEQMALFQWAEYAQKRYPELSKLYHTPNGGRRDKREAARLKREGVKPGVPDLCLPVARGGYHGLYIELKAGKNTATPLQRKWIAGLIHEGYAAAVCTGWEEARMLIEDYLGMESKGQQITKDDIVRSIPSISLEEQIEINNFIEYILRQKEKQRMNDNAAFEPFQRD